MFASHIGELHKFLNASDPNRWDSDDVWSVACTMADMLGITDDHHGRKEWWYEQCAPFMDDGDYAGIQVLIKQLTGI